MDRIENIFIPVAFLQNNDLTVKLETSSIALIFNYASIYSTNKN